MAHLCQFPLLRSQHLAHLLGFSFQSSPAFTLSDWIGK
jgi:hypothetical protein